MDYLKRFYNCFLTINWLEILYTFKHKETILSSEFVKLLRVIQMLWCSEKFWSSEKIQGNEWIWWTDGSNGRFINLWNTEYAQIVYHVINVLRS